jgi:hypothetical protein
VGRGGEAARPLLEGEQLGRAAGGELAALDRPVAAAVASWPSGWRKMRGGARASARESTGEGRVGRLKATGPADRWAGVGERGGGSGSGRGGGREVGGASWAKGQVGR